MLFYVIFFVESIARQNIPIGVLRLDCQDVVVGVGGWAEDAQGCGENH